MSNLLGPVHYRSFYPYWPERVGWYKTRLGTLVGGTIVLAMGIFFLLDIVFPSKDLIVDVIYLIVAFLISSLTTIIIFNSRKNQSIIDFFFKRDHE